MKNIIALLLCCISSGRCFGQLKGKIDWGEKFNSTAATLVLMEIERARLNGQTVVTYHAYASGLPKDVDYTLWLRLVGGEPQSIADAFINQDGLIVNVLADPAHHVAEDPIDLKVVAGRGEPKRIGVISNDGQYRVFAEVVPFPIENVVGVCKISATMMAPNYFGVQVAVTGLQPKEALQIVEQSGSEQSETKATAEFDGSYRAYVLPFAKGQTSGKLRFKVASKSCVIGIEAPWGQGSYVIQ
jgi:hypothetical protein